MNSINLDSVTAALENARVSPSGVSFAGKSLKLDSEDDAKQVVDEIQKCSSLQYLNLEGNTLGVDASKAIAKAIEKHPEFKRALWKDMFTGRMKTEIPKALKYLGEGLVGAGARLTELDLSDNAFGPIGVEGLAALLRSSSCYALEELRLNNNGLGITGGKLLASALTDCYDCSRKDGKPLALKVFIAGRNRLENEGARALASVFRMIGTLEEIAMPQNGIYHPGISALSDAFTHNKNLQILNLNDNTIGPKGAAAIASALPDLQNLREINFGDCLLKTKGALLLAGALKTAHPNLEELTVGFNEIRRNGALSLVESMANKSKLKNLILDGNQFGEDGKDEIEKKLKEIGKLNVLGSLEENESEDSENDDTDEDNEDGDAESEDEESENENVSITVVTPSLQIVTVEDFLKTPSANNFIALGSDRIEIITKEAKKDENICLEDYVQIIMKVSSLCNNLRPEVADSALKCSELLYKDLFSWTQTHEKAPLVNNSILVNLGLIKSEDRKKVTWNLEGCLYALKYIANKNYVPDSTKSSLKLFLQRDVESKKENAEIKKQILSSLAQ